jgi:hypothetical protein
MTKQEKKIYDNKSILAFEVKIGSNYCYNVFKNNEDFTFMLGNPPDLPEDERSLTYRKYCTDTQFSGSGYTYINGISVDEKTNNESIINFFTNNRNVVIKYVDFFWKLAMFRGTELHKKMEYYAEVLATQIPQTIPVDNMPDETVLLRRQLYTYMQKNPKLKVFRLETLMIHKTQMVAGTPDCILLNEENNTYEVLDWKRSKNVDPCEDMANGYFYYKTGDVPDNYKIAKKIGNKYVAYEDPKIKLSAYEFKPFGTRTIDKFFLQLAIYKNILESNGLPVSKIHIFVYKPFGNDRIQQLTCPMVNEMFVLEQTPENLTFYKDFTILDERIQALYDNLTLINKDETTVESL